MESEWVSVPKTFSELPRPQRAARLEYTALFEENGVVRFSVCRDALPYSRADTLRVKGLTREQAEHVLTYLRENAVTTENWRDVMEDVMVCLREQMDAPQILPEQ